MLSVVISVTIFVVTIVAWVQIITKAGYSAWWILLPLAMPVVYTITVVVFISDVSGASIGAVNVNSLSNQVGFLYVLDLLVVLANFIMFLVFAFSDWPVMQEARSGRRPSGGMTFLPPRPSGGLPGMAPTMVPGAAPAVAVAAPPSPHVEGKAAGWFTSGALGSGEQSYWDGSSWTARRQWKDGAWADLPTEPPQGPAED